MNKAQITVEFRWFKSDGPDSPQDTQKGWFNENAEEQAAELPPEGKDTRSVWFKDERTKEEEPTPAVNETILGKAELPLAPTPTDAGANVQDDHDHDCGQPSSFDDLGAESPIVPRRLPPMG